MKIFVKISATIVLISMLIQGCKKDVNNTPNPIVGNWEWIRTLAYGGGVSPPLTPDVIGFKVFYNFDNNGFVHQYLDSTLFRSGKYSITTLEYHDNNPFTTIKIAWNRHFTMSDNLWLKHIGINDSTYYQMLNDTLTFRYFGSSKLDYFKRIKGQ